MKLKSGKKIAVGAAAVGLVAWWCLGQGIIEETDSGLRMGRKYAVGNVSNLVARVDQGTVNTFQALETLDLAIYAFRRIGTNGTRVYSAVGATNSGTLTSNAVFKAIVTMDPVQGASGYVLFGSVNGGPYTNSVETTNSDPTWIVFNKYAWTATNATYPPMPASPFFLGISVSNAGTWSVMGAGGEGVSNLNLRISGTNSSAPADAVNVRAWANVTLPNGDVLKVPLYK